ncbi:class I SAM-dependent methyltransferase [Salinarimonas soli]|uniref:Class I SAM-dependent methyltransferase n=1 Tax=Salinarimonas soli TaxID=1638099 RepID=A0A5B2VHV8_9HYPH|nr:class I SAM-dependent methyltransferase [Salinarimonas soli]KAA2238136.1 class I SAM-dependent methyltransferase [Salinarimonas soli]
MNARSLAFGLATVLGVARRGFFIPYRHAAGVDPIAYPALAPLFERAQARFTGLLGEIDALAPDLLAILGGGGPARFDQTWFPRLDAAAAYAMVRRERPARIVEVGSGHSTRFLARAVADGGLATAITCIDPQPRRSISGLPVTHDARLLGDDHRPLLAGLDPGDILFIDSSHLAVPGSDVDRLFLDILPRLAPGVLVHVHDVTLPDAYPAEWAWRGYNEQLLVGALLQGGAYEILFAGHWAATRMGDRVAAGVLASLPLVPGARETSLWLRKRA